MLKVEVRLTVKGVQTGYKVYVNGFCDIVRKFLLRIDAISLCGSFSSFPNHLASSKRFHQKLDYKEINDDAASQPRKPQGYFLPVPPI
jgi:hypothetical protein